MEPHASFPVVARSVTAGVLSRALLGAVFAVGCSGLMPLQAAMPYTQATVTRLENKVSYGKQQGKQSLTRPAVIQDTIKANSFLLSEGRSRAELQYLDGTLVRVGENTLFSFEANSRTLALTKGVFFFYVPKGSGGANLKTPSIAAAITGTVGKVTVNTIVILDGSIRLIPSRRTVAAGQFARRNPDGSITIDYFDKAWAPRGLVSADGAAIRKGLERDVLDLAKRAPTRKPAKATPTPTPAPKGTNIMAKEASKDAAQMAAHTSTRAATAAAAQAAAQAASSASKSASKGASHEAAKPTAPRPPHGGGGMCFVAGTLVHTPSGVRRIEELRVNDEVLSLNARTGKIEPAAVVRTWKSQRADLMKLNTPEGAITCSQNHRFYTVDREWQAASLLPNATRLMGLSARDPATITASGRCTVAPHHLASAVSVYNLTVAGNSNYFVGRAALLCHNTK